MFDLEASYRKHAKHILYGMVKRGHTRADAEDFIQEGVIRLLDGKYKNTPERWKLEHAIRRARTVHVQRVMNRQASRFANWHPGPTRQEAFEPLTRGELEELIAQAKGWEQKSSRYKFSDADWIRLLREYDALPNSEEQAKWYRRNFPNRTSEAANIALRRARKRFSWL